MEKTSDAVEVEATGAEAVELELREWGVSSHALAQIAEVGQRHRLPCPLRYDTTVCSTSTEGK